MITIYEANATDFSTLGLCALDPSECVIEEQSGGMYELTIRQPITDDMRHAQIAHGRIIKAPAPVRETPLVEIGHTGTSVTRSIYKVVTDGRRLSLRVDPDQNSRNMHAYKPGTEVAVIGTSGSWSNVIILDGGATGWMWSGNLEFVRDETETISGDTPGDVIKPRQTREQLFRVYNVEVDNKQRVVIAKAQHITYDLAGVIVSGEYNAEDVPASTVCAAMLQKADHESGFHIYCTVTDTVSIDCTGRGLLDIICNADDGILAQTGARLIRDNYDLFIIPPEDRGMGVELRYAKNLLSAYLRTDTSNLVTRIQPAGKTKDGETLLISDDVTQSFVDSDHINEYPTIKCKRIEYDVVESDDLPKAQAREKLAELARADYSDNGVDLPNVTLDASFVRLELSDDFAELANAYALHLYDTVPVIDGDAGIVTSARMTGYKYDAVLDRYETTTLGELTDANVTVYGYEIGGGVSGTKILPNSMGGDKLRDLSVSYAKIGAAAIEHLSADSIVAIRADIRRLVAGEITTDQLYADLASIAVAQITTANIQRANIDWALISNLTAEIAQIARAEIGTAKIDYAKITDLVTDTAIITEGVGGQLYINRLAVTDANMVSLTTGKLMLKASDGSFVQLVADGHGGVTTQTVQVDGDNIANATISGGKIIENSITARELNVASIFADQALIRAIKAANIDVADLFAAQATINALDANLIKASNITALEGQLNVWANDKINLAVGEINIGGANLKSGTSNTAATLSTYPSNPTVNKYEYGDDYPDKWCRYSVSNGTFFRVFFQFDKLVVGKTYTLSAEVMDYLYKVRIGAASSAGDSFSAWDTWNNYEKRISCTFTANAADSWLSIDCDRGTESGYMCIDVRKVKLEEGNKATAWCQADDELVNSAMTIDTNGIRMTGGTIDMQAGTAFKVKSGGTVQIDASSADNSYINLGNGNFSASKDGGVVAEAGHFGTALDVKGKRVLTEADVDRKIIVSTSQPSGHNLIWLKPSSVTAVNYSAFTASSRDASVDFYRQPSNKIRKSFACDGGTLPNGATYTYTVTIPIYSTGADMTDFKLAIYFGKGSYIYLAQTNIVLTPWHLTNVTFTTTSNINMCANTNAISMDIEGTKNGSPLTTNVYLQKDMTITLSCSASGGSGTQACSVYYVP